MKNNPMQPTKCGARTRKGTPCKSPVVHGRKRCRMHGGALGSGAPQGNQNALKHGLYTRQAMKQRRRVALLLRELRANLEMPSTRGAIAPAN
jgi:hypothetical protein